MGRETELVSDFKNPFPTYSIQRSQSLHISQGTCRGSVLPRLNILTTSFGVFGVSPRKVNVLTNLL